MRTIYVTCESTVLTPAQVQAAVAAINVQLARDFGPAWGMQAGLAFYHGAPPPGSEVIHVLDDSDQADALGYHSVLGSDVPVGFVFARTTINDGEHWTVTLSHEALEQVADPYCQATWLAGAIAGRGPAVVALEVCDPVEGDEYLINNVPVSNFILPTWSTPAPAGTRLDFLGKLTQPLQMTAGGYIAYSYTLKSWLDLFGERARKAAQPIHHYNRRGRRRAHVRHAHGAGKA